MMLDLHLIDLLDHILDRLDPWVAEFQKLVAIETNQMIMLPIAERLFVLRQILAELMPTYQVAVYQEV